jgi:hypothetical protein
MSSTIGHSANTAANAVASANRKISMCGDTQWLAGVA